MSQYLYVSDIANSLINVGNYIKCLLSNKELIKPTMGIVENKELSTPKELSTIGIVENKELPTSKELSNILGLTETEKYDEKILKIMRVDDKNKK